MKCAACKAEMAEKSVDGVVIDECERCGGVWLDAGEDRDLHKEDGQLAARDRLRKKKLDLLREYKVAAVDPRRTDRGCPRCGEFMVRSNYRDVPGLQVDTCPKQCGMYLDKGELDKIRLVD